MDCGRARSAAAMNRRTFLRAGVAAGMTPLIVCAQPSRPKIKVGFLGVAHSHAAGKWKVLQSSADYELVGIAEESAREAGEIEKLGAKILSARDLLAATELVVVESAVRDLAKNAKLALS